MAASTAMKLTKRLMAHARFRAVVGRAVAAYIRLVRRTSRWTLTGQAAPEALWDADRPFILAFWHNRLMMMPLVWRRGAPIDMLISHHRDGDLIARTIAHFGLDTVRGSTAKPGTQDKGGAAALRLIVKSLRQGRCVGFTPDGPRGPRLRASEGVVAVARLAGVPILPAVAATSRRLELSTWDRFLVALPFSRGVLAWGAPIHVGRDDDLEAKRLELETAMNDLAAAADRAVGRQPLAPEPLVAAGPAPQPAPLSVGSPGR